MTLNVAQQDAIDSVINPIVNTIAEAPLLGNTGKSNLTRTLLWGVMMGSDVCIGNGTSLHTLFLTLNTSTLQEVLNLSRIFSGQIDIFQHHTMGTHPTLGEVRVALFKSAINALHEAFPQDQEFPLLPGIPQNIQGMERIRALFLQYATLTMSGSIERHLLALEIILEKEKLGIPSYMSSNDNIYGKEPGYAPGDFSGLDLSKMHIERNRNYSNGNFKGWHLKNSKFDGTSFKNICLYMANFENSSLKGVDFTGNYETSDIVWTGADITGMYAGDQYTPSRRANNHALISKSVAELTQFRLAHGLTYNNNNNNNNNNNHNNNYNASNSNAPVVAAPVVPQVQAQPQPQAEPQPAILHLARKRRQSELELLGDQPEVETADVNGRELRKVAGKYRRLDK